MRERDPLKVLVALMCGVLFATHPIHTEAVNNIVGRAEILSAILILGAALVRRRGRIVGQLASAIMYFASMLCKETACTFLGILGLSGLFSIASGHRSHRYKDTLHRVLKLAADVLPECCAFGAYIILRFWLSLQTKDALTIKSFLNTSRWGGIGLGNSQLIRRSENPFAFTEGWSRTLSMHMLHTVYASLLVAPYDLCAEYSYNCIPMVNATVENGGVVAQLGHAWFAKWIIMHGTILSMRMRFMEEEGRISFHSLMLAANPVSSIFQNLIITVGTLIGERLLYLPSIGFCVILSNGNLYVT